MTQWYVRRKPPEFGLSLRMVSVKTGQTLWSVNEVFNGQDAVLQEHTASPVRDRISKDIAALAQVACTEIAKTLNF